MDPGEDNPVWKPGLLPGGEPAKENRMMPMTRRKRLWRATFNMLGGNHIMPTQPAPPMYKFCDAPAHRVWEGDNIGRAVGAPGVGGR